MTMVHFQNYKYAVSNIFSNLEVSNTLFIVFVVIAGVLGIVAIVLIVVLCKVIGKLNKVTKKQQDLTKVAKTLGRNVADRDLVHGDVTAPLVAGYITDAYSVPASEVTHGQDSVVGRKGRESAARHSHLRTSSKERYDRVRKSSFITPGGSIPMAQPSEDVVEGRQLSSDPSSLKEETLIPMSLPEDDSNDEDVRRLSRENTSPARHPRNDIIKPWNNPKPPPAARRNSWASVESYGSFTDNEPQKRGRQAQQRSYRKQPTTGGQAGKEWRSYYTPHEDPVQTRRLDRKITQSELSRAQKTMDPSNVPAVVVHREYTHSPSVSPEPFVVPNEGYGQAQRPKRDYDKKTGTREFQSTLKHQEFMDRRISPNSAFDVDMSDDEAPLLANKQSERKADDHLQIKSTDSFFTGSQTLPENPINVLANQARTSKKTEGSRRWTKEQENKSGTTSVSPKKSERRPARGNSKSQSFGNSPKASAKSFGSPNSTKPPKGRSMSPKSKGSSSIPHRLPTSPPRGHGLPTGKRRDSAQSSNDTSSLKRPDSNSDNVSLDSFIDSRQDATSFLRRSMHEKHERKAKVRSSSRQSGFQVESTD